ncbi:MAG TPA: hypothetical protein VN650_04990 [Gemmatimonadaceae bacterium]|nr:hypothetical protein [Gemmatimonadaceae bacterium]
MDPYTAHTIIRDVTFIAIAAIAGIGYPMARAYGKRVEKGMANLPRSLQSAEAAEARMERIERAVEAMALEVERMAEGQRFMTKLLAEPGRLKPPESKD